MAAVEPPKEKEEIEEEAVSIIALFKSSWEDFLIFVKDHIHLLNDAEAAERIYGTINVDAALALVVLSQQLTPEIQEEILNRDEAALRARMSKFSHVSESEVPADVIERAFAFGELFIVLVNEL